MKKIINVVLILALVLNMFALCTSAAGEDLFTFSIAADKTTIKAGESVNVSISVTNPDKFLGAKLKVTYPKTLFNAPKIANGEIVEHANSENGNHNDKVAGQLIFLFANVFSSVGEGDLVTVTFTAKADVEGDAEFKLIVDPGDAGIEYAPTGDPLDGGKDVTTAANSEDSVTVKVGGEEPKVFTVTPAVDGTDVKVTVANKGDKTGTIYVATFNGDVLVDCKTAELADGTLTFSGLAGTLSTAKVFVWDEKMIPVLATPATIGQ